MKNYSMTKTVDYEKLIKESSFSDEDKQYLLNFYQAAVKPNAILSDLRFKKSPGATYVFKLRREISKLRCTSPF